MESVAYPMAFGHWSVQGQELLCRLPRKTVAVSAPGALLRAVVRLCDGRTAWREVAAALGRQWSRGSVDAFLDHLAHEGVLVEAGQCLARWTDLGQIPALSPQLAGPEELPGLPRIAQERLLPGAGKVADLNAAAEALADVLRRRQSDRTFADHALGTAAVCTVLWAAHGVARAATHAGLKWHRTVASGGNMHSARWFVYVLRELPDTRGEAPPGLYEARFHVEGGASLHPLPGDVRDAWRVLLDPRVLRYASALVLPVYDIAVPARKYGNRATLFAHLEAGQSLQNAQLMAAALGAAAMVRGDTAAAAVVALLATHLGGETPPYSIAMPALVLGAKASPAQAVLRDADDWLRIGSAANLPAMEAPAPFAFFAGPVPVGKATLYASGRAADPRLALTKAEAEAWERHAWGTLGPVVEGRMREVEGAMAPHPLVTYTSAQYARPGFPPKPFSPRATYLWCDALQVGTGLRLRLPAECVHAFTALPPRMGAQACTNASTSGIAAWPDAEGALCRATLELIERDAFARSWLAHTPPSLLQPQTLPATARRRVAALEGLGHRVVLARIGTEPVPVLAVFVQHSERPFTAITAAADFDPEAALSKALDEAEGRAAHAAAFPAQPLARAAQVRTSADVGRYYQTPRFYRQADFYAAGTPREDFACVTTPACRDWPALQGWLAARGFDLLAVDLTPEGASVDQGRTPLRVVRAFVPGLIPIWFQHGLEPAGLAAFRTALGSAPRMPRNSARFVHPFT